MKTNKRLAGSRRSVHANLSAGNHARLQRHAAACSLSASKYTGLAVEFLLDLEDASGGPITEQARRSMIRVAAKTAEAVKKLYS
jgi:hypothetical protein